MKMYDVKIVWPARTELCRAGNCDTQSQAAEQLADLTRPLYPDFTFKVKGLFTKRIVATPK